MLKRRLGSCLACHRSVLRFKIYSAAHSSSFGSKDIYNDDISIMKGKYFVHIGQPNIGEILFLVPISPQELCQLPYMEFQFTYSEITVESEALNGPSLVVVANSKLVTLQSNLLGVQLKPIWRNATHNLFYVPHFSKYRIMSSDEDSEDEFEDCSTARDLSVNQRRMYDIHRSSSSALNVPLCIYLSGDVEMTAVASAVRFLLQKYPILRSTYIPQDGSVVEVVRPFESMENIIDCQDVSHSSPREKVMQLLSLVNTASSCNFSLDRSVFLASVLKVQEGKLLVLLLFHHICIDGMSIRTLLREFQKWLMSTSNTDLPGCLVNLPMRPNCERIDDTCVNDKWKKVMEDITLSASFPLLGSDCTPSNKTAGYVHLKMGNTDFHSMLCTLQKQLQVPMLVMLGAAYGIALCATLQSKEVVIGCVVVNRVGANQHDDVGFYANTLPICVQLKNGDTFLDILKRVYHNIQLIHDQSNVLLPKLLASMKSSHREYSNGSLNFIMVQQDMMAAIPNITLDKGDQLVWMQETAQAQVQLSLEILPHTRGYTCRWQYQKCRLTAELVTFIHHTMLSVVTAAFSDVSFCVNKLIGCYRKQASKAQMEESIVQLVSSGHTAMKRRRVFKLLLSKNISSFILNTSSVLGIKVVALLAMAMHVFLFRHSGDLSMFVSFLQRVNGSALTTSVRVNVTETSTFKEIATLYDSKFKESAAFYMPLNHSCEDGDTLMFHWEGTFDLPSEATSGILLGVSPKQFLWMGNSSDTLKIDHQLHSLILILIHSISNLSISLYSNPLLPNVEEHFLTVEVNNTAQSFDELETIMDIVEASCISFPMHIAFVEGSRLTTYVELWNLVKDAACVLTSYGAKSNEPVAILLSRSTELFVYMLAILFIGAYYVPIATQSPANHIIGICSKAAVKVVVTETARMGLLQLYNGRIVFIDTLYPSALDSQRVKPHPQSLAYVIYTSGTSGAPKGVCVTHRNLRSLMVTATTLFKKEQLQFTRLAINVSFDPHTMELYPTLLVGGCCLLVEDLTCPHPSATYLSSTPSALSICPPTSHIQLVVIGGESLSPRNFNCISHVPNIINAYGPSECTVMATGNSSIDTENVSNIGSPVANTQVFVLDENKQICPFGAKGILHIAGHGVTKGYLNDQSRTDQNFVENTFGDGQLYYTGDIVSMRMDGTLDYCGRKDNQVKIHGMRLELSAVVEGLLMCTGVEQATVVTLKDELDNLQLIGYVSPNIDPTGDILKELKLNLPPHMIPSKVIALDSFPLTKEGKIDQRNLPKPKWESEAFSSPESDSPQGKIRKQLKNTFASVLKVRRVSRGDDFYSLGGHSILAAQLANMVSEQFDTVIKPSDISNYPSPAELASKISPYIPSVRRGSCISASLDTANLLTAECSLRPLSQRQWMCYMLHRLDYPVASFTTTMQISLFAGNVSCLAILRAANKALYELGLRQAFLFEREDFPVIICSDDKYCGPTDVSALHLHALSVHDLGESKKLELKLHRMLFDTYDRKYLKEFIDLLLLNVDTDKGREIDNEGELLSTLSSCVLEDPKRKPLYFPSQESWSISLKSATFGTTQRAWEAVFGILLHIFIEIRETSRDTSGLGHVHLLDTTKTIHREGFSEVFQERTILSPRTLLGGASIHSIATDLEAKHCSSPAGEVSAIVYPIPPLLKVGKSGLDAFVEVQEPLFLEYPLSLGIQVSEGGTEISCHLTCQNMSKIFSSTAIKDFLTQSIHVMNTEKNVVIDTIKKIAQTTLQDSASDPLPAGVNTVADIVGMSNFKMETLLPNISDLKFNQRIQLITTEEYANGKLVQSFLESTVGVHIPMKTLLLSPSWQQIEASLACLYNYKHLISDESEILLLNDGKMKEIFCFPDLRGSSECYRRMASKINNRMIGLQLNAETLSTCNSIESVASSLVSQLSSFHTSGSYQLLGYSFGAVLAFEAARLLLSQGRSVSLILIDGSPCLATYLRKDWQHFKWTEDSALFANILFANPTTQSQVSIESFVEAFPWFPMDQVQFEDLHRMLSKSILLLRDYKVSHVKKLRCKLIRVPQHRVFQSYDYDLEAVCDLDVQVIHGADHYSILKCKTGQIASILNVFFQ